ncbi:hypothetical protein [Caulobacter vibrioides]|uniref:hypothetical protein n=1 Tax=Caulobacter vibrioides TaxID=155892 RepID=UPI000F736CC1|nr:hypothetical protein [Caulobacter vibrioides]
MNAIALSTSDSARSIVSTAVSAKVLARSSRPRNSLRWLGGKAYRCAAQVAHWSRRFSPSCMSIVSSAVSTRRIASFSELNIKLTPHLFTRVASIQAAPKCRTQPEIILPSCDNATQLTLGCASSHKPEFALLANSSPEGRVR